MQYPSFNWIFMYLQAPVYKKFESIRFNYIYICKKKDLTFKSWIHYIIIIQNILVGDLTSTNDMTKIVHISREQSSLYKPIELDLNPNSKIELEPILLTIIGSIGPPIIEIVAVKSYKHLTQDVPSLTWGVHKAFIIYLCTIIIHSLIYSLY